MSRILIGVPLHKPKKYFLESLAQFKDALSHKVEIKKVEGKELPDAQNEIAEEFLNGDYDYLLFMEEDHSGHTPEMLESLLLPYKGNPDAKVVAMKYYSRHKPYLCCLMKQRPNVPERKSYIGLGSTRNGYHEVDLCGFGMTIMNRAVFDLLDKPYFRYNECRPKGTYGTDKNFIKRLKEKGVIPLGCFDHCLEHDGINEDNLQEKRWQYINFKNKIDIPSKIRKRILEKSYNV